MAGSSLPTVPISTKTPPATSPASVPALLLPPHPPTRLPLLQAITPVPPPIIKPIIKTVKQLTFISPSEPTPYRRPAQNIDVQLSVTPSLDATDTVQILLDGQPISQGLTASIPTLELNPGEHTLTAQIISHGDGHPTSTLSQVNQTIYVIQNNLAVQNKRALQRKKAVYDSLPWYQKLYFNLRQDNPFADVAKTP